MATTTRPPARSGPTASGGNATGRQAASRAYLDGLISEMRRVTWPSRREWVGATILTIALVVTVGFFTEGADWVFSQLFKLLHGGNG